MLQIPFQQIAHIQAGQHFMVTRLQHFRTCHSYQFRGIINPFLEQAPHDNHILRMYVPDHIALVDGRYMMNLHTHVPARMRAFKGMDLGIPAFQISLRSRLKAMDSDMDLPIGQLGQSIHAGLEVFFLPSDNHIHVRSQGSRIESRNENIPRPFSQLGYQIIGSLTYECPKPGLQQLLLNLLGRCRSRIQSPELLVLRLSISLDPDFLDDPARPDDNLADRAAHGRSKENPGIVLVIEQRFPC